AVAAGEGIAAILVEPARLCGLDAVADAELLERLADGGDRRPVEVLEADVVGNAHALVAQLPLREADERAMDRLGPHRLGAQAGAERLTVASERADADEVEADLDRLDDLERLEQADAATAERGVGEPVAGRQRLAAG